MAARGAKEPARSGPSGQPEQPNAGDLNFANIDLSLTSVNAPSTAGAGVKPEVFVSVHKLAGVQIPEPGASGFFRVCAPGHSGISR